MHEYILLFYVFFILNISLDYLAQLYSCMLLDRVNIRIY